MKILIPGSSWVGGIREHIGDGFRQNGIEPILLSFSKIFSLYEALKIHQIQYLSIKVEYNKIVKYNNLVINKAKEIKPDLFLTFSGGKIFPSTVEFLRNKLKIKTISIVADNPFDSSRDNCFSMSLQHYHHIFVCDGIWIDNISKIVKSDVKIYKYILGYNPKYFFPISQDEITDTDIEKFSCDMSFTGSNYGNNAEGAYRAGILNQLQQFNVKVWGEGKWEERFKYYENLQKIYKGKRLEWSELRKLYTLSKINLNMPSPQIYTSFQPRLFDIAAVKGFQIIDKRPDLFNYFKEDELVTFESIPDLIEKANYFIKYPEKREVYVENLYKKIAIRFTWLKQVKYIIDRID